MFLNVLSLISNHPPRLLSVCNKKLSLLASARLMEAAFLDIQLPALLGKLAWDTAGGSQAIGASISSDPVACTKGSTG